MDSPFQQNTTNASEGQLLPIQIKQKELLDDSQSSHTEPCEDDIPSEILPERSFLGFIREDFSRKHHSPSNQIFEQNLEELKQEKDFKEHGINYANMSTQDLHLMLQQNIVKISEQSQLCVQISEELQKRFS